MLCRRICLWFSRRSCILEFGTDFHLIAGSFLSFRAVDFILVSLPLRIMVLPRSNRSDVV